MAAAIVLARQRRCERSRNRAGSQDPPIPDRPARIAGHPNFNGIWQAMNTAYWNLESHSAEA